MKLKDVAVIALYGVVSIYTINALALSVDSSVVIESKWIVSSKDNICGVSDPRQITNPAKINYKNLLNETIEVKKMKSEKIDKNSPEGQILYNAAISRIRDKSLQIMNRDGYCSVWKKISNTDGRIIPDITSDVLAILNQ